MNAELKPKVCVLAAAVSLVLLFCLGSAADPLVTRDDFNCRDTSSEGGAPGSPRVAISVSGAFSVTSAAYPVTREQFNRFDRNGNRLQPGFSFLPDTAAPDTIWQAVANSMVYCNDAGACFVCYWAYRTGPGTIDRQFGIMFDSSGQVTGEPVCLQCEPQVVDLYMHRPKGGINSDGDWIAAWCSWPQMMDGHDSVFVRLYSHESDSLSPIINPMHLPQPEIDVLGYNGDYRVERDLGAGIADDGSFVVAWVAQYYYSHVFYVVYNADGTPRTEVGIADCDGSFADSAQCAMPTVFNVDIVVEPDGDFYLVWMGQYLDIPFYYNRRHIWMRGFNADGTPKYAATRVNDTDSLNLMNDGMYVWPDIACGASDNVLVVWSDGRLHRGLDQADVFVQKVDPLGNLVGPNMRVNNILAPIHLASWSLDCDLNDAGQAIIIWKQAGYETGLMGQLMPYDQIGRFTPGDINADLSGDVADLTTLVDYLFGGEPSSFWPLDLTDFDASGGTNVADLTYLVDYLFGDGPIPSTPHDGIRPNPGKPTSE